MHAIGFMTGTFDPPHHGHTELIRTAIRVLRIQLLFVLVNVRTEHKPLASRYADRKQMTRLSLAGNRHVAVAPKFLEQKLMTAGPDSIVNELLTRFPDANLYRVIGGDSYRSIPESANNAQGERYRLAIFPRDEDEQQLREMRKRTAGRGLVMPRRRIASSTELREEFRSGVSSRRTIESVQRYIDDRKLYQETSG